MSTQNSCASGEGVEKMAQTKVHFGRVFPHGKIHKIKWLQRFSNLNMRRSRSKTNFKKCILFLLSKKMFVHLPFSFHTNYTWFLNGAVSSEWNQCFWHLFKNECINVARLCVVKFIFEWNERNVIFIKWEMHSCTE